MVKPQLNLDKKDDLKKPDGTLVKVVTISEEPAPLNPEPIYAPPTPRRGGRACKCLCLALTLILFFLTIIVATVLFLGYGNEGSFCSVGYYDDWYYDDIVYPSDYYYNFDSSYDGSDWYPGKRPYGDDMLNPPKPTGPPILRYLKEGLDINLELRIIRINRGEDDMFPAVNVLHDFNKNISAYSMPSSGVCYILPLDMQSTLTPEDFQYLMDTEAYKDMDFPMNSKLYTVNPERATDLGEHIEEMCDDYSSYYISSVPTEQWPTFWTTARQVLRDHFGGRRGSSSSDEEGRRGGRHRGGSSRHGSRGSSHSDSSSSSSDEEGGRRSRGIARVRDYLDNMRSFDGQQVVDMHVFQTHNLDDLSPENLEKLTDLVETEKEDGFMP
ncbi:uncharacterized protein [Apostichopus japonicus]|uniref:uncharacterized protein n=1 Tax=Stichopus japonicus TaxID=307972 RepID=UPI003AB679E7